MRLSLQRLLQHAGVGPLPWERIVLRDSRAALTSRAREGRSHIWNRGFHMVILDAAGAPEYYCKCRPSNPGGSICRESLVMEVFNADAATAPLVPSACTVRDDDIEVLVTRFLSGTRVDKLLPDLSLNERTELAEKVLSAGFTLSSAAAAMPRHFPGAGDELPLAASAARAFELLPSIGVTGADVALLRQALEQAGAVRAYPQHRDLWPRNVIVEEDGRCRIVDFDEFGEVMVPMTDAIHYLRTSSELAGVLTRRTWLERIRQDDDEARALRGLLAREPGRWGLTPVQAAGCLLFYLLDITTGLYYRPNPESVWGRFRDELPVAAALLRDAGSVDQFAADWFPAPAASI